MVFKQIKSPKIALFSVGVLSTGFLFASILSTSVQAQDSGGGESLPEEVESEPLETEPVPEEVTPEAGETSPDSSSTSTSVELNAEPGSYACLNNPNPACGEPRNVAESWASDNNPGPEHSEPPRLGDTPLEPGSWACTNNQNVVSCENPIRYTVEDKDAWPNRFPPAGERISSGV